jgi:uncharacterized repeat protein (TIGR02543 family)
MRKILILLTFVTFVILAGFAGCGSDDSSKTYTITFYKNDVNVGSATATQKVKEKETISLMANPFTREGYTFAGWSTTLTGAVEYADKANYTMGSSNVELYAKWTENQLTIIFHSNDGKDEIMSQNAEHNTSTTLMANSFTREGHTFAGWSTTLTGAVEYADGADYPMETSSVNLYAIWNYSVSFNLGDTGPAGGKIFYKNDAGFIHYTEINDTVGITCHYLEAALVDIAGTYTWWFDEYGYGGTIEVDTGLAIGTGLKNTLEILGLNEAPAATVCANYDGGGKNDWFLPSKDELAQLYTERALVGNLGSFTYWSSSDAGGAFGSTWEQNFGNGNQNNGSKSNYNSVRPIRAF